MHQQMNYPEITWYSYIGPTSFTRTPRELVTLLTQNLSWISPAWDSAGQHYYSAVLATSTIRTYKAAEHRYLDFCSKLQWSPYQLQRPLSVISHPAAATGYFTQHNQSLSGIQQVQIAHGFMDPHMDHTPWLRQVLKGITVEVAFMSSHHPFNPAENRNSLDGWNLWVFW